MIVAGGRFQHRPILHIVAGRGSDATTNCNDPEMWRTTEGSPNTMLEFLSIHNKLRFVSTLRKEAANMPTWLIDNNFARPSECFNPTHSTTEGRCELVVGVQCSL